MMGMTMIRYHIFSQSGRSAQQFVDKVIKYSPADIIIFPAETVFLVCKREEKTDEEGNHILDIYLREIQIGLCDYVVINVNHRIFEL